MKEIINDLQILQFTPIFPKYLHRVIIGLTYDFIYFITPFYLLFTSPNGTNFIGIFMITFPFPIYVGLFQFDSWV